jgi:hypothetical protein
MAFGSWRAYQKRFTTAQSWPRARTPLPGQGARQLRVPVAPAWHPRGHGNGNGRLFLLAQNAQNFVTFAKFAKFAKFSETHSNHSNHKNY